MQGTQTASLDTCVCKLGCCFLVAIPFGNFIGMPNKEAREVTFASLCCLLCPWCELHIFLCCQVALDVIDSWDRIAVGTSFIGWMAKPIEGKCSVYTTQHPQMMDPNTNE